MNEEELKRKLEEINIEKPDKKISEETLDEISKGYLSPTIQDIDMPIVKPPKPNKMENKND